MLIIIISLTLIGVVAIVLVNYFKAENNSNGEPTIQKIVELSYDTPELTIKLQSNDFVKLQLKFIVDNKDALEEIQMRDFQIENIVLREMSNMKASDLEGSDGIDNLENRLKLKINELMQEGMVVQVYVRRMIVQ